VWTSIEWKRFIVGAVVDLPGERWQRLAVLILVRLMVEAERYAGLRQATLTAHRRRCPPQVMGRKRREPEEVADAGRLHPAIAVGRAAESNRHRLSIERHGVANRACKHVLLLLARERLLEDLQREIGERLIDDAPLLDPPRRDVHGPVLDVQLVAVDGQQLAAAERVDLLILACSTLNVPGLYTPSEPVLCLPVPGLVNL
jgi:hypothetical protein